MLKTRERPTPQQTRAMITELIERPPTAHELAPWARQPSKEVVAKQTAALERRAQQTVLDARRTGAEIEFLGVQPLFHQPRVYPGQPNDWVVGPLSRDEDLVIPKREQQQLARLEDADIGFSTLYIAHELPEATADEVLDGATGPVEVSEEQAAILAGPPPPPPASVALGDRLAHRSSQIFTGMRVAATAGAAAVAAVAAAPLVVGGAAIAGLAQLDPIIVGVDPFGEPRTGTPAGWYLLAQWDW